MGLEDTAFILPIKMLTIKEISVVSCSEIHFDVL